MIPTDLIDRPLPGAKPSPASATAGPAATQTVKTVCPYCGVGCGMVLEVREDRVVKLSGDKGHPANGGRLCTKGTTAAEVLRAANRMTSAYRRPARGAAPVAVSTDAAITETARRLRAIMDRHGPDALAFYVSGQMSVEAQYLANKLAKGFVATNNIDSNSRLCMSSAASGYKLSLGADGPPGSYDDFDRANLFFVAGANMADCHPILFLRMMDRVRAGAKLIVVDPRRTATAAKADLFLQIRPATDLALLNGILHLLVAEGRIDRAFIDAFTDGFDALEALVSEYPPARVAEITGVAEADLRRAADWIGEAPDWISLWTMGLNQSVFGTWNTNAICNLHLATGAICRPGSGPFSLTGQPNAMGGREVGYLSLGLPGQRAVTSAEDRAFVETLWQLPAGRIKAQPGPDTVRMFEQMAAGEIKAAWVICTNPVASVPNRANVLAGLAKAELVIAQDAFLDTETNRHADILLPGALWAEAEGVMINSERNLTLMPRAVPPPGEALPDWQIIARVACEMGFAEAFSYASAAEVFDEIRQSWNPKTGYDIRGISHDRLREGPVQWPCPPRDASERHPIRYLNDGASQERRTDEDGQPLRLAFPTASGRAQFLARPYLPAPEEPDAQYPYILNTGRLPHQWHTMTKTGTVATLNKLNSSPFVELNPEDARELGLRTDDRVEIRSRRGRAVLPVIVTDRVQPGSLFSPFHWNDVFGTDLAINVVTNDATDPVSFQPGPKYAAVALSLVEAARPALSKAPAARALESSCGSRLDRLSALLDLDAVTPPQPSGDERLYLGGFLAGLRDGARDGVPVLPPAAPLAPATRLWVDGMLAGLFSRTDEPPPTAAQAPAAAKTRLALLWASQTGNAEALAERFAGQLGQAGLDVRVSSMAEYGHDDLGRERLLLLVSSTYGDGDPPDNGQAFWDYLASETVPHLDGLRYAVLALGDPNYEAFCRHGERLDARLTELGASRLTTLVRCDPDYEEPAAAWLTAIAEELGAGAATLSASPATPAAAPTPRYSKANPFPAQLTENRRLNPENPGKETRHLALSLIGSGLAYEAGDSVGLWPRNDPALVTEVLALTGLDERVPVTVKGMGETSLGEALLRHYEIARPSPDALSLIAARTSDASLRASLAPERKSALRDWLWGRQLADVLHEFPVRLDADELLAALRPLQPRSYSIASSPKLFQQEVHLTLSTVRYACGARRRGGVCSAYLADRALDAPVPLFIQRSSGFRPPASSDTPMIMVGPGTGIAPFRAFLQERQALGARGRNWLFFGEQHAASDFYYRDELERMLDEGALTHLSTAFSRDQAAKIYVQDRMLERGGELWAWLQDGAHVYVCGDAIRMARDVDETLREIAQAHGGMSPEAAKAYFAELSVAKRYVRDVY